MSYYEDLLRRPEWKAKREEILLTRKFCYDCGRAHWTRKLEIHHSYYELGRMPWDYPDRALIPLCRECHRKRHELGPAPSVRRSDGRVVKNPPVCSRCGGACYFSQFKHVEDGVCFRCWGSGFDFDAVTEMENSEK